jgi:hypothetical protein
MSINTMHNTPAVYIPTQPEGNGLTLPALLSLLVHGIVIGLLIYNYQSSALETAGNIETMMVSPEQLAEIQGQILANRAAASVSSQQDNSSSGAISSEPLNPNDNNNAAANASEYSSQNMPMSTRSDDVALMNQQQRLTEKSQEFERDVAERAAQLDTEAMQEIEAVEQNRQSQLDAEEKKPDRLKELRTQSSTTPKIREPNDKQRNIDITSGNSGKNYNLADGESTISGDLAAASPNKGSSRSAATGSRGVSNSEIVKRIKDNYNPPTAAKGTTQRTTLTITVDANGNVINVSASGADSAVNEAAKQAVLNTRNLPIDTDDPKYPTFTLQFNGSN